MGGTMAKIFGSTADGAPSPTTGQNIMRSLFQGSAMGMGSALQKQATPEPGGKGWIDPPPASPVDPRFFTPQAMGNGGSAFYGG